MTNSVNRAAGWKVTAKADREAVKAQVRRLFAPLTDEQFDAIPLSSAYGAWLKKKGRRPSDWSKSRINNLGGGRPEDYDYYDYYDPDGDISVVFGDARRWKLASATFDNDKDLCWNGKRITILAENKDAGASICWTGLVDRDFSQGWMSLSDMTYHERKKLCENYTIGSTAFDSLGDLRLLLDARTILNILDHLITGTTEDDFNHSCQHQEVEAIYDWLVQEYVNSLTTEQFHAAFSSLGDWELVGFDQGSERDGRLYTKVIAENKKIDERIYWMGEVRSTKKTQGWEGRKFWTAADREQLKKHYEGDTYCDNQPDHDSQPWYREAAERILDYLTSGDAICFAERSANIIKSIKETEAKREAAAVRAKKLKMAMPLDKAMGGLSDAEEWTVSQAAFYLSDNNTIEITAMNMRVSAELKWTHKLPSCHEPSAKYGAGLWTEILHILKGRSMEMKKNCEIVTLPAQASPDFEGSVARKLMSVADFVLDNIIEKKAIAPFLPDCDHFGRSPVIVVCAY